MPWTFAWQKGRSTKAQIRSKTAGISPTAVPTSSAAAALTTLFRSSRRCSMSGIRPSGLDCRCDAAMRVPSTRAPVTVSPSFDMAGYRGLAGSAGLLRPLLLGDRSAVDGRRLPRGRLLLEVTDLLLQLLDLLLVLGSRHGLGLRGGLWLVIAAHVLHLGLQYAHRPPEGPGGLGHLLLPDEDDEHRRDDEYLPRAVEQVTEVHVSPHSAGSAFPRVGSLAPESLHATPAKPSS